MAAGLARHRRRAPEPLRGGATGAPRRRDSAQRASRASGVPRKQRTAHASAAAAGAAMNPYLSILQSLIPLYLIIILGYVAGAAPGARGATLRALFCRCGPDAVRRLSRNAGRFKMADDFLLDRLNSFNAKARCCAAPHAGTRRNRVRPLTASAPAPRLCARSSRCLACCTATSRRPTCTAPTGGSWEPASRSRCARHCA